MLKFNVIDTYKDPETGDFGAVVINDKDRIAHDFKDLFPSVILDGKIYKTYRVHSNQIHVVKKRTRIIIYIKLE